MVSGKWLLDQGLGEEKTPGLFGGYFINEPYLEYAKALRSLGN
jgi:hypothetical protein